ncbi:hypothetical protein [Streptosporangium sp. NPDC049376]
MLADSRYTSLITLKGSQLGAGHGGQIGLAESLITLKGSQLHVERG